VLIRFIRITIVGLFTTDGLVPISNSGRFFPFAFVLHTEILGVPLSCAETMRKRIASPNTATTRTAPPIAAPITVPVDAPCGPATTIGAAARPATGFGEGESVGPGVSVGVTEGEAPIRRVGVGLGVSVGVTLAVIDEVGVGV